MEVHNPANTDFKCPTCLINFDTLAQHKDHYKSDFHRYNLKRKMVKLAPASFQQFKSKRGEIQADESADDFKCNQCGKKFASAKTFDQHVQTKKHNPNAIKTEQQVAKPKAGYKKNSKQCLFCKAESATFSQNLRHMQSTHSFFIAQLQYCTNQEGLIEYLQQKIQVGFLCITCQNKNAKDFSSGEAVRKHMVDKGHTFMKVDEDYDEYLEFYDFSTQFKEIIQSQKDKVVPGIQFTTMKVVVKDGHQNEADNEQDWQDDSSSEEQEAGAIKQKQGEQADQWESDEQNDEKEQQIKQKQEAEKQKNKKSKVKVYHIMRPTPTANGQLLLPNGKILGHRKYRYLYRQTYRTPFWLNQNIKALGYQFTNNSIISRQKMIQLAKHDRLIFNAKHRCDKRMLRDGMQNNILQKYFRTRNSL